MSFDLAVLAMDESADAATVAAMFERCTSGAHPDGELDERIAGFYEQLRSVYPGFPPYPEESPWMSMPLSTGIDHVIMHVSYSPDGDAAIKVIERLARLHGLVLWDPQFQKAFLPPTDGIVHYG